MKIRWMLGILVLLLLLYAQMIPAQKEWIDSEVEKANHLIDKGKFDQAIQLLENAFAQAERMLGLDHPSTGFIASELANSYLFKDELDKAVALLNRLLSRYEEAGGPSDPRIAEVSLELANIYESADRINEALRHYKKVVAVFKQHMETDDPFLLDLTKHIEELEGVSTTPEPEEDVVVLEEVRPKTPEAPEKVKTPQVKQKPEAVPKPEVTPKPQSLQPGNKEGFVIQSVECPATFTSGSGSGKSRLPAMTVTYQLITAKEQVKWNQRFEVIGPGGEIGDAGGGMQWYSAAQHGGKKTYEVKGYSLLRKPGIYRFKLTLEGENLEPVIVERKFELR
jgi:hypothetical protein